MRAEFEETWRPAPTCLNAAVCSNSSTSIPCCRSASIAVMPPMPPPAMRTFKRAIDPSSRWSALAPIDNAALVAVELHAAERTALIEIADRIGLELRLLGKRVLAMIFAAAGGAIAEIVGAVVV